MTIIGWFVRLAPVGIFALIGNLVATVGFRVIVDNLRRVLGGRDRRAPRSTRS